MSIADKLVTIAENEQRVYKAGQLNVLANAESLNGSLSGEGVSTNDVIDIKHNVACSLSGLAEGPNIIDPAAFEPLSESQTADGCSVRVEDDRVNISGGVEQSCSAVYNVTLPKGGYTLRIAVVGSPSGFFAGLSANVSGINMSFIENEDTTGNVISLEGRFLIISSTNITISVPCPSQTGFSFNISLTTPADYSSVKVSRYGKNLFEFKQGFITNATLVEYLDNGVIAKGNLTSDTQVNSYNHGWYNFSNRTSTTLKSGDVVTISADYTILELAEGRTNGQPVGVYLYGAKANSAISTVRPTLNQTVRIYYTYTIAVDGDYYPIITLNSNKVRIENIQIECGSTPTTYEPFKEPTTYTANADGTVEGITSVAPNMTLLTDTDGVVINANYYKDPDIVISNLAQSVALSGGEG